MADDLAARLEAADPDNAGLLYELSEAVLLMLGWKVQRFYAQPETETEIVDEGWHRPDGSYHGRYMPEPARSVDDGLTLLREMGFGKVSRVDDFGAKVQLLERLPVAPMSEQLPPTSPMLSGSAKTEALAQCAALVRAASNRPAI